MNDELKGIPQDYEEAQYDFPNEINPRLFQDYQFMIQGLIHDMRLVATHRF